MRRRLALLLLTIVIAIPAARADAPAEYRGYWVETFNTLFNSQLDVLRIVDAAVDSNANALFVQVRRRGDSWYLDSKEPLTETPGFGEPDAAGRPTLDPLRYLIEQAHARGIEVHAFVIIGAVGRDDPAAKLPADPRHVFLEHVWDRNAGAPHSGSRQWATRALPHNSTGTSHDGYRFGTEWYLDLGHPEAAAYTVDVLAHLAKQYALDGIHLDRIRYPEAPIDGTRGINVGYNETSVTRFKAKHGSAARYYTSTDVGSGGITQKDVGYPRTDDPLWQQWRRDQVTNFVRRLYLTVKAVRPSIRVSAALITFGSGPSAAGSFANTEPYWRVFQDWQSWTRDRLLDLLVPMVYKREDNSGQAQAFVDWSSFTVDLAHSNAALGAIGLGAYLNGIEGTIRQVRSARAAGDDGVVFYALGNTAAGTTSSNSTNTAVTTNPFSYPTANRATPKWSNENFFSALRTGASVDGATRFEPPSNTPLYAERAPVPQLAPRTYVRGLLPGDDGVEVVVRETTSATGFSTFTDGSGFWGFAGLPPGLYRATVRRAGVEVTSCMYRVDPDAPVAIDLSGPCPPRRRSTGGR